MNKIKFYHSLTFRLCVYVFVCVSLVVCGILFYWDCRIRVIIENSVSNVIERLNIETAQRIRELLFSVEGLTESLKRDVEENNLTQDQIRKRMRNMLSINPNLFYASSVTYLPGSYYGTNMSLYSYWNGTNLVETNLNSVQYDYSQKKWFTEPLKRNKPVWTEPYYDLGGGGVVMTTYSTPFYTTDSEGNQVQAGVVTADLGLAAFNEIINHIRVYVSGYAILISGNGELLVKNKKESVENQSEEEKKRQKNLDKFLETIKNSGFGRLKNYVTSEGDTIWMYRARIEHSKWSVLFIVREEEVLEELSELRIIAAQSLLLGLALLLLVVLWVSTKFTSPIISLTAETGEIAKGNLDIEIIKYGNKNEVGLLSHSIDNMRISLKDYIASLGETMAEKERITSELQIAKGIQNNFLVSDFNISRFDNIKIYALVEPAKEVGGDLYTFFKMDSKRLFFAVGDVSGKGVPAALFMAVTLTLMKGMQHQDMSPARILKRVGHELFLQNENTMFVTVFCGILDIETGLLVYSNAGHLPPIILDKQGEARWLKLPKGVVLGVINYPVYEDKQVQLLPGESIFVYTDGVNEAMNKNQELFGEERLLETMKGCSGLSPQELTQRVSSAIREYTLGESQSDDITMLTLEYEGPLYMKESGSLIKDRTHYE